MLLRWPDHECSFRGWGAVPTQLISGATTDLICEKEAVMKVLVVASNMDCLSEVSSPRSSLPSIDRAPVEEAIRLRENGGADEVVIVAIGDVEARIMLR